MKLRKTEIVLLTLGIVTTAALMVSPKTDTSVTAPKHVLTAHVAQTVAAPAAELKPVEVPVIAIESHENAVISDFVAEPEEVPTEEPEPLSEPENEPEPDYVFEAASEPEPEPVEEPSEDSGMTYLGTYTISGYCSCVECAGIWSGSPTASGAYPTDGWTCASNWLPFGTMVYIEGIGVRCVEDRGDSIMTDDWLDLFYDNHDTAQSVGLQSREVYLINE